jgi:hypothetical protein
MLFKNALAYWLEASAMKGWSLLDRLPSCRILSYSQTLTRSKAFAGDKRSSLPEKKST